MIYLYLYILACVIFSAVYSFGQIGAYILAESKRFKLKDDLSTYLTNGIFILAAFILTFIVATVLAPVIVGEDMIKKIKARKEVKIK